MISRKFVIIKRLVPEMVEVKHERENDVMKYSEINFA